MSKRVYVTYVAEAQERKKLMKFEQGDLGNFSSITQKIKSKFSLPSDGKYSFEGIFEENGPYVEIDDMDEDILEDIIDLKFSEKSNTSKHTLGECLPSSQTINTLERSASSDSANSFASTIDYMNNSQISSRSVSPCRSSTSVSTYVVCLSLILYTS